VALQQPVLASALMRPSVVSVTWQLRNLPRSSGGYGTFQSAPPDCPVIWLRTGTGLKEELFPFGVVVALGV
jgi:hypothetical protein